MSGHVWETPAIAPFEPSLSLELVLDALDETAVVHAPRSATWKISWCQAHFQGSDAGAHPACAERNVLYFAEADGLIDALDAHPHSLVVFIATERACAQRLATLPEQARGRVLALTCRGGALTTAAAVSLVQIRLQEFRYWGTTLKAMVRQGASIQQIVDLGEAAFGNFIHVSDGSYTLLGHTTGIEPSGDLNTALVERGYHDAATVRKARAQGEFDQWEKQHGVKLFEPRGEIPYPFMTYVMKHDGQYCGHVVMICNQVEATTMQTGLFEVFATACNEAVERDLAGSSQIKPRYYGYLAQLISDARVSQDFISSQSATLDIPAFGCFRLALFDMGATEMKTQQPFLASILAGDFPGGFVFQFEGSLLMLTHEPEFSVARQQAAAEKLARICAANDCIVYLSDDFARIRDIRLAYQQVCATEKHRRHIDVWLSPKDDIATRRVFTFDGTFPFACFGADYTTELKDFCLHHSALERLSATRAEGAPSDLQFLHRYLFNERRTAPTAQQLGMHRNSIIHRANGLRARFGIDLDDPAVRERLAICIRLKIATDPAFASALV